MTLENPQEKKFIDHMMQDIFAELLKCSDILTVWLWIDCTVRSGDISTTSFYMKALSCHDNSCG